jgi:hypothetical protein
MVRRQLAADSTLRRQFRLPDFTEIELRPIDQEKRRIIEGCRRLGKLFQAATSFWSSRAAIAITAASTEARS